MMSDINCPYCNSELDIDHDEGVGYEEGVRHEMNCHACDKNFTFTTSISYYYEPEKADCLNGSEHNYMATHTFPKEFTQMQCSSCEAHRKPTETEWEIINSNGK